MGLALLGASAMFAGAQQSHRHGQTYQVGPDFRHPDTPHSEKVEAKFAKYQLREERSLAKDKRAAETLQNRDKEKRGNKSDKALSDTTPHFAER